MARTRKKSSKKNSNLPWLQILIVLVIAIIIFVGYQSYQSYRSSILGEIKEEIKKARQFWQSGDTNQAGIIAHEILLKYPDYLSSADRNNIGICLWDGKDPANALIQFAKSYDEEPVFSTADNFLGCWIENSDKIKTIAEDGIIPIIGKMLTTEVKKFGTAWDLYKKSSVARCLYAHGLSQQAKETYEYLIKTKLYESEFELFNLRNNLQLANFFEGNWEDATEKFIQINHELIERIDLPIKGIDNPRIIHNLFEKQATDSPNVEYSKFDDNIQKYGNYGANIMKTPPSYLLSTQVAHEFSSRQIYQVLFKNIEFEFFGLLYTQENEVFLQDIIFYSSIFDLVFSPKKNLVEVHFDKAIHLPGLSGNYYHWLIENIGRITLFKKAGLFEKYPDIKILTPFNSTFLYQSLDAVGIARENVVLVHSNKILVDEFYGISTLPWDNFDYNCVHLHIPPREAMIELNKFFNPRPLPLSERHKIIYFSRTDVIHRHTLKLDTEFTEKMAEIYGDNFVIFDGSKSFLDQVALVKDARLIIGPHGAALANIVFASPNSTAVIEFPTKQKHLQFYFSHIAASLDMYHWILPSVSSTYYGYYQKTPETIPNILQAVKDTLTFMKSLE